jgi:hypothetical protein
MAIPDPPSAADIAARIRAVLPARWFPDTTPVLDAVLAGLSDVWRMLFLMLDQVRAQTRIATATGAGLDLVALDFFGPRLLRGLAQGDAAFRAAIRRELLRSRATRPALEAMLADLTAGPAGLADLSGPQPRIFEPSRPADTGAWGVACAWGVAGGWGSLALPYQCFVDVTPAAGTGIAQVVGWNRGAGWGVGPIEYAGLEMLQGQLTHADINRAIAAVLPAGAIAWVRIGT